ncbi:MAG: hypothetical protein Q8867_07385 [Bacteroidota bacterium]|nr:hypothetical protein [Bacteroidota bacterium]
MKRFIFISLCIILSFSGTSQVVYQDLTWSSLYDFIDELANLKVITITSVVKPYSREFIAEKLKEASEQRDKLSKRQKKELDFYMKDFNLEINPDLSWFKKGKGLFKNNPHSGSSGNPPAFLYRDSLFTFSFRPIWGILANVNENGSGTHRWGGVEVFGYVTHHVGFYASLRDNNEHQILTDPHYLNQEEGAAWKNYTNEAGDYSEMRGGISYSWNWGTLTLAKDHFQWGDNYHGSNIFSGRTPSFPFLQLEMKPCKWFNYHWLGGMLISQVIDSSRTYYIPQDIRNYYFNKFLAAALMTFTPVKGLDISAGNSVISCADYFNPAFLSPFLFFTRFKYSGNAFQDNYFGNNSQAFINVSSRNINHLHLYGSVFMDDFNWKALVEKGRHNFFSYKAGFRLSDFPVRDFAFTTEYTFTDPMTYKSSKQTLTFASNKFNLGNYLRDNSQEIYVALDWRPIRGLICTLSWELSEHGKDDVFPEMEDPYAVPVLSGLEWKSNITGLNLRYEVLNDCYIFGGIIHRIISGNNPEYFTPEMLHGETNTLNAGFNIGF